MLCRGVKLYPNIFVVTQSIDWDKGFPVFINLFNSKTLFLKKKKTSNVKRMCNNMVRIWVWNTVYIIIKLTMNLLESMQWKCTKHLLISENGCISGGEIFKWMKGFTDVTSNFEKLFLNSTSATHQWPSCRECRCENEALTTATGGTPPAPLLSD